ncbi:MAG: YHS domain-containing protein [Methanomicrobiales archaeon]|nr:YHS domain-containing protein [Methanomicrobiales archaeon]
MPIDPVCGMNVHETQPENESFYKGIKYYFCSAFCREEFDRDPGAYMYTGPDESEADYHGESIDSED